MDKINYCDACGAAFVFMKQKPTFKNPDPKPNPIERLPSDNGNLLVEWSTLTYSVVKKDEIEKAKRMGIKLHTSHFATCPKKERFRRPK